jgi:ribose transport system permease protein
LMQVLRAIFRRFASLLSLLVMCGVLAWRTDAFLTVENIMNVGRQIAEIAIMAVGQTLVIIAGGIDLSVGSVMAFSGVSTGLVLNAGGSIPLAVCAGLLAGSLCGGINGFLVTRGRIPPFVVTLGMMGVASGVALVMTGGTNIFIQRTGFDAIGLGRVFRVPIPLIIMVVVAFATHVLLSRTRAGRYFYAIGGSAESARLSGVPVGFYQGLTFLMGGLMAGLGGVLLASRLGIAQPTAGQGYELDTIAAAVIGGASLMGGVGTIPGTLIGAFIMAVLRNGCNLLDISEFWQRIAIGTIVVLAVYYDHLRRR